MAVGCCLWPNGRRAFVWGVAVWGSHTVGAPLLCEHLAPVCAVARWHTAVGSMVPPCPAWYRDYALLLPSGHLSTPAYVHLFRDVRQLK